VIGKPDARTKKKYRGEYELPWKQADDPGVNSPGIVRERKAFCCHGPEEGLESAGQIHLPEDGEWSDPFPR
jgi:hypothetical protein